MKPNRIVTGHDQAGRSTVASSGPLADLGEFRQFPGFAVELVWQTAPGAIPAHPVEPAGAPHSVLPAAGGSCAMRVTFPPEAAAPADFDPQAAARELCERLPGLGELFEADAPGFHRTDTIDYGVVLDGEITLELDDGCSHRLCQGDLIVQMGTRHAWRNTGNRPARLLFVMVGAPRGKSVA